MTRLRVQDRDDPLALTRPPEADSNLAPNKASAPRADAPAATSKASRGDEAASYVKDRQQQAGWRLYESLLAAVRERASEIDAAGTPCSSAALVAATLDQHLPTDIDTGVELMRRYRAKTAARRRVTP